MNNNELFDFYTNNGEIFIKFKKLNIDYPEDIKCFDEDFFCIVKEKRLFIEGRAPVEIYVYVVFWSIKNEVESININEFNLSNCFEIYRKDAIYSENPAKWCSVVNSAETATLSIISSGTSDGRWSAEFIRKNAMPFIIGNSVRTVILTGRGSLLFYSILASSAAISACENVFVRKPTESALVRVSGSWDCELQPKKTLGRMIGVLGDPNSGKSVFSKVFGCVIEKYGKRNVWVYDCDAAAPTSDWYIYGLQMATDNNETELLKQARNSIKQKWTLELERKVAKTMHNVKNQLDFVIADLPGGYHCQEKNIHKRIPDSGRAEMLKACDGFIIIERSDRSGSFDGWKSELESYNIKGKVLGKVISMNPDETPKMENTYFDEKGIFHATVCGLSRNNSIASITEFFYPVLKPFIDSNVNKQAKT